MNGFTNATAVTILPDNSKDACLAHSKAAYNTLLYRLFGTHSSNSSILSLFHRAPDLETVYQAWK